MTSFLKRYYPVLLSILILVLLIKSFAIKNINEVFTYFSIKSLLFALGIYFFIKIVNTYRYKLFFHLHAFWKAFLILCFSNFMLNILPFRAGELSYIRLFKKHFGLDYEVSVSKLIVLRVMDYVAVSVLFFVSIIYTGLEILHRLINIHSLGRYIFIAFIIMGLVLVGSIFLFKYLLRIGNKFALKLKSIFESFLRNIKTIEAVTLLTIFVLSIVYWLIRIFLGYVILLLLNITPGFFIVMFISMILMVVDSLPFRTVAGFGIFEGGWLYLLGIWGYSGSEIFIKLLTFHILILITTTIWGVFAWIYLRSKEKTRINSHIIS